MKKSELRTIIREVLQEELHHLNESAEEYKYSVEGLGGEASEKDVVNALKQSWKSSFGGNVADTFIDGMVKTTLDELKQTASKDGTASFTTVGHGKVTVTK